MADGNFSFKKRAIKILLEETLLFIKERLCPNLWLRQFLQLCLSVLPKAAYTSRPNDVVTKQASCFGTAKYLSVDGVGFDVNSLKPNTLHVGVTE